MINIEASQNFDFECSSLKYDMERFTPIPVRRMIQRLGKKTIVILTVITKCIWLKLLEY